MLHSILCIRRNAFLLLFVCFSLNVLGQNIIITSWNLKDFGQSKTAEQITFIANTLSAFDAVAIQEVVAGYGGPKAVIRLVNELNKGGAQWEYTISHGTSSDRYSKERYAFLWKKARLQKVGEAWLENKYQLEIEREPYFVRFKTGKKTFTLSSFHAQPKSKQPEKEIKYFQNLPALYPAEVLIFCGDFNLPQSHSVFTPLKKMGYAASLKGQKTSLRQKCINNDCLASEYDNFFYPTAKVKLIESGIVPFYKGFEDFKAARKLSDHVPVYLEFSLN